MSNQNKNNGERYARNYSKEALEKMRERGRVGGQSRSRDKIAAARKNIVIASRGKVVAEAVQDVERLMCRNRELWLVADDPTRAQLDVKFEKWVRLKRKLIETKDLSCVKGLADDKD